MDAKHRARWLGMSLLVGLLTGCGPQLKGSGNVIDEDRQTPDFAAVEVDDGIQAIIVVDPTQPRKVRIIGDDNLVERVRTEVRTGNGTTLRVHLPTDDADDWSSDTPLRAEVTLPELTALVASGASSVELSGAITSDAFSLEASGASRIRADGLETQELTLVLSGASEATARGYAHRVTNTLSGASQFRARQLTSREASLVVSGGSTAELQVSDLLLKVTASGGSDVTILGRPIVRSQELSGGASLRFE
ncbi:DUF2807 domain-containing protein [Pyxidicoccus fallax]|uniref:DUF2807 domain-containing protein n=1 Tax=Pyxidicoccus fallax TaxID=394095 RepID=A0A848L5T7_9BACT|nr:head GIN domain-containing protein [Pyxidicoccus fallax]NMO13867.1 DUF2807 domain-containing protein [Pyxidicoccus fallax]NPC77659.1 DUF2807 domain-containing protein [Pyxidicoccus fallax]